MYCPSAFNKFGKNGCGIVAAFTAQRGAFIFIGRTNKTLRYDHLMFFQQRRHNIINFIACKVPVDIGIAEIIIGPYDIANVSSSDWGSPPR